MVIELPIRRAARYAALGDPHRLAIIDELRASDRSPSELKYLLDIDSNLLAHHLGVLEHLGVVERIASQGDRRRRYVRLVVESLADLQVGGLLCADRIVFVCTENAARSQLAQAIWNQLHPVPAISAGITPAHDLHPGTVAAAARRGLDLGAVRPRALPDLFATDIVITVCDRAHETLTTTHVQQLHWSIPDPAASSVTTAYDDTVNALEFRITMIAPSVHAA